MTVVREQIPNLINGVSQQPPSQRLPSQCEEQENCLVDLAEGLKKRPPLEHLAKVNGRTDDTIKVHTINRDTTERFKVIIYSKQFDSVFDTVFAQEAISVNDLSDGSSVPVTNFSGDIQTYLTSFDPLNDFKLTTIADTTFIVNKTITALKDTTVSATRAPEGIVFLKQATSAVAAGLTVYVDGVIAATATASSDANVVVDSIFTGLEATVGSGGTGAFTVTKFEQSNVHLTRVNGADFDLHVEAPEANMVAIKDTVETFSELPARTKDGFIIRIVGDPSIKQDDFYLKHNNSGDITQGEWVETVAPGLQNALDASTLPIKLTRTVPGFDLAQVTWTERAAGDETTVPDPSFIGEKIRDIFFYKNRFGILGGENAILSELGEFFNFYLTTATDLIDTDPIDVAAPSNDVNILEHAVPFDKGLLVFSDREQFEIKENTTTGLTPNVAILESVTEYLSSRNVKPIIVGTKLYFTETRDGFASIREFGLIEDLINETAEEVSAHVPSYIRGDATNLQAAKSDNLLFVMSSEVRNEIYLYKFLFQQGQKRLSSWGKWTLPSDEFILDAGVIDSISYPVIKRSDGTYIEKVSLQTANLTNRTESTTSLKFKVLLDRLTTITGVYDSGADVTTFTVPYAEPDTLKFVMGPAFDGQKGSLIQGMTRVTGSSYTVSGDFSAGFCWVGKSYFGRYTFTEPILKTVADGKPTSLDGDRLTIKKFNVRYFETPFFELVISSPSKEDATYTFSRIVGSPNNILGDIPFETGNFQKIIKRNAEDLTLTLQSDSYLPFSFTNANWTGNYVSRSRPRRGL